MPLMDAALKAQLAGYAAHRNFLEGWLQVWTWLVVIGVACELIFIILDHRDEWREWFHAQASGIIPFPSKPNLIKLTFEILSVVFVVAGVSGELVIDSKLGTLETNVQDANESRVSQLNWDASQANERASALEKSTQQLKTDAENAHKDAETERLARVNIEARVAFRALSDAVKKQIADDLRPKVSRQSVEMYFNNNDAEAELFADDIQRALSQAGITGGSRLGPVERITPPHELGTMRGDFGVTVSASSDAATQSLAKEIVEQLNAHGFDSEYEPESDRRPTPTVVIYVAPRPRGPQGEWKLAAQQPKRAKPATKP